MTGVSSCRAEELQDPIARIVAAREFRREFGDDFVDSCLQRCEALSEFSQPALNQGEKKGGSSGEQPLPLPLALSFLAPPDCPWPGDRVSLAVSVLELLCGALAGSRGVSALGASPRNRPERDVPGRYS